MADELTQYLVNCLNYPGGPRVTKYSPLGGIMRVCLIFPSFDLTLCAGLKPYFNRSTVENAGIVGDAISSRGEQRRFVRELRERLSRV